MNKLLYMADFFVEEINGGAEQNDHELLAILEEDGYEIIRIKTSEVTLQDLTNNLNTPLIVSNFVLLGPFLKNYILNNMKYVLYMHDHQYLLTRDPGLYENFTAPKEELCNVSFFQKALAVFVQTNFHKSIVDRNLEDVNTISVGGNLWSEEILDFLEEQSKVEKEQKTSVMLSQIKHKNSKGAIKWCESNKIPYEVISPCSHREFLKKLGKNEMLAFFPLTPETLSRIVVEARMMGCKVATSKDIGALYEEWSHLKGLDLISVMRTKREKIPKMVLEVFGENKENNSDGASNDERSKI